MQQREEMIRFEKVSKFFPGVVANKHVDLTIYRGEFHTLLGENGAGKTTLMNILYGLYKADEGTVYLEGKPVNILSPSDAMKQGIGMIHQHFMLIPNFSVWENVVMGQEMKTPWNMPVAKLKEAVNEVAKQLHISIDLDQSVSDLTVGMQQKVEILKAIYRGSRILILDEPTSVLTPQESEELFETLEKLQKNGCTIIFISHKMKEVMKMSNNISVLRDGKLIQTLTHEESTPERLTSLMVGRDVSLNVDKKEVAVGDVRLELRGISMPGKTQARSLKNINFKVRSGEVLGIAGVDGNGQSELSQVIAGIAKQESGMVLFNGNDVSEESVRSREKHKLSYIPADRRGEGLALDFRLFENASMTQYYKEPFSKNGLLQLKNMRNITKEYIEEYRVKTPGTEVTARTLSGGNQQKLVLAREIQKLPDILLVVQPTWGLDIGACSFVYEKIMQERERGTAILLISTDLEEVRSLSDRLMVLFEGQIMGEVDPKTADIEEIGFMMSGLHSEKKEEVS